MRTAQWSRSWNGSQLVFKQRRVHLLPKSWDSSHLVSKVSLQCLLLASKLLNNRQLTNLKGPRKHERCLGLAKVQWLVFYTLPGSQKQMKGSHLCFRSMQWITPWHSNYTAPRVGEFLLLSSQLANNYMLSQSQQIVSSLTCGISWKLVLPG